MRMLMLQFMGNTRNNKRVKANGRTLRDTGPNAAGPSTATSATDPNDNGNGDDGEGEGENLSNVNISDIDE